MTEIPADIIERAACFDADWPLRPDLSDRPCRMKFWGREEAELATHLEAAGLVVQRRGREAGAAWASSIKDLAVARRAFWDANNEAVVMSVFYAPRQVERIPNEAVSISIVDGREIATLVAEIHLPDGRRHLLAKDDYVTERDVVRYIWMDGNWSCDCNRSLDLHRDGVGDLGFPLREDGEPDAPCTPEGSNKPSLRLGWLVLRFRHLVTGVVRFEVVAGADGVPIPEWGDDA